MQPVTKQTIKVFWQHSIRYPFAIAIIAVGIVIATINDVVKPWLYKAFFDALAGGPTPEHIATMKHSVYLVLALITFHITVWRVVGFVNNFYQARVKSDLLNTCYAYLQDHSYGFFANNFVGALTTRVRRYQQAFESIADQICWSIGIMVLRISMIVVISLYHLHVFGMIMLVWVIINVTFNYYFSRFKLKYDIAKAAQDTLVTAHLSDTITNNNNVKLFSAQLIEAQAFERITEALYKLRKQSWDIGQISELFQGVSMIALEFILMYTAIGYWERGILSVGDVFLLRSYMAQIFEQLWNIGHSIRAVYEGLADANEMTTILMTPHELTDIPRAKPLQITDGLIEFRDVSFRYGDNQPVLSDFNLTVQGGAKVALVGPSGEGKTTITKILVRFLEIQKGTILIDGQNIAEVTQSSLRSQIAFVQQESMLFGRTVAENIRYGSPNATLEQIMASAQSAQAHDFITKLPNGYDTVVGERGVKLSGGQRQRVAIARAILKNAPILIFDEATSSLDAESELYIQQALKTLMEGKTTIIIAHRNSTIRDMDDIILIKDCGIAEKGTHQRLLDIKNGIYAKLWRTQAGGFQ